MPCPSLPHLPYQSNYAWRRVIILHYINTFPAFFMDLLSCMQVIQLCISQLPTFKGFWCLRPRIIYCYLSTYPGIVSLLRNCEAERSGDGLGWWRLTVWTSGTERRVRPPGGGGERNLSHVWWIRKCHSRIVGLLRNRCTSMGNFHTR
jgi:hypothetical protein